MNEHSRGLAELLRTISLVVLVSICAVPLLAGGEDENLKIGFSSKHVFENTIQGEQGSGFDPNTPWAPRNMPKVCAEVNNERFGRNREVSAQRST